MGCITSRSRPARTRRLQWCQRPGLSQKKKKSIVRHHANFPRTSSTPLSTHTTSPAITMMPTQRPVVPRMPSPIPGQALARTVRLGKVSSLSRFVMLVVRSTPITRIRSTFCSPMDMIAGRFGVVLFAVVILRRRVTLSMLLIWVDSKALSISVTRTLDTRDFFSGLGG